MIMQQVMTARLVLTAAALPHILHALIIAVAQPAPRLPIVLFQIKHPLMLSSTGQFTNAHQDTRSDTGPPVPPHGRKNLSTETQGIKPFSALLQTHNTVGRYEANAAPMRKYGRPGLIQNFSPHH